MRAVLLICRKELNAYFASPIAYLLMAFFALIFGFVIFNATTDFLRFSFQMTPSMKKWWSWTPPTMIPVENPCEIPK